MLLLASTALSSPAWAVNVGTETELRNAIFASNGGGDSTINVTGNITLTQSLPMITASVTVTGNNNTIDAANTGRVIFAQNGTVAVSNLTINNAVAQGGAGGSGAAGAGGGLGAGAAVFVNNTANVTLTNVVVGNASATGGAGGTGSGTGSTGGGGGGGLGGAGGSAVPPGGSVFSTAGGGGGGYAGAGGSVLNGATGGGGGGGEFGAGGTTNTTSSGGGGGGGGQQGAGGTSSSGGGGGGGAVAAGGAGIGVAGGGGGGAQGGTGGATFNPGSPAAAPLGGGGGGGVLGQGASGALSGGGGGTGGGTPSGPGGAGGVGGGGGGGGSGLNSRGGAGGDFGGGAGAGLALGQGGTGGFGGGGGSAGTTSGGVGGAGGFGGGGGGSNTAGAGGALGGTGGAGVNAGGGGGAALGGAIFVRDGGSLTISGGNLGGTYSATGGVAGSGGTGATAGQAQGRTMFLQGTGTTAMNVASGTQTLAGSDALAGTGGLSKSGAGTLALTGGNANYSGNVSATGGTVAISAGNSLGTGGLTLNGGTLRTDGAVTVGNAVTLGSGNGTVDTNGNNATLSAAVGGTGGLTKQGTGTMTLAGANTYGGATTVNAGTLQAGAANTLSSGSAHTVAAGGTLDLNSFNQTIASLAGAAGSSVTLGSATLTAGGDNSSTTYSGILSGTGSLAKQGTGLLNLTGINTYTGPTTVNAGTLAVNGSITSNVTVGAAGTLGGSGTIFGGVVSSGIVAPGNSIGTLTVNGSFTQNGGVYQVEVNAAGQSDRINVVGAPGTATINGGTVAVLAQAGTYARNTTYTILSATGGRTGTYTNVTSNFAFLTPSLSYDANNVYLLLLQQNGAFAAGAQTGNQRAVGTVLDQANAAATGDFSTVLSALSSLSTQQGPAALDAISGQQYSGFGTANISGGFMFMNVLGQQMSQARGGSGGGTRVALAEACDVSCDGTSPSPWSLWGSALGATGSVAGSNNSATVTYNAGGVSTGVDYRFDPRFLAGIGVGFASGNQWANGFNSRGTTDSYSVSLYGSFTQGAFYLDALAGYAYNDNQMTRQIAIPGLAPRTAMGRTGANQLLGQAEAGYRFGIYEPAAATLTPFARFQAMTVNQAAFSETGADSLNLNVAQQTTNSVRTVIGAELAGGIDMGWREKLGLQFRLGWAHEYADTSRPLTASFAGAPTLGYTVYGAAPQRDTATVGFAANTAIAEATSVYLRYDGEVGTGIANHVFSAGIRMSW